MNMYGVDMRLVGCKCNRARYSRRMLKQIKRKAAKGRSINTHRSNLKIESHLPFGAVSTFLRPVPASDVQQEKTHLPVFTLFHHYSILNKSGRLAQKQGGRQELPARILLPIITSGRYHHTFAITSALQVSSTPFPFRSVPHFTSSGLSPRNHLERFHQSLPFRFTHSVLRLTTESARIFAADCNDYPRVRLRSLKLSLQHRVWWPTRLLQTGSGENIRRLREGGGDWCVSSMLSAITRADVVNLLRHFAGQSPQHHLMVYPAFTLPLASDLPFPLFFRCHFAIPRMRAVLCSAPGLVHYLLDISDCTLSTVDKLASGP